MNALRVWCAAQKIFCLPAVMCVQIVDFVWSNNFIWRFAFVIKLDRNLGHFYFVVVEVGLNLDFHNLISGWYISKWSFRCCKDIGIVAPHSLQTIWTLVFHLIAPKKKYQIDAKNIPTWKQILVDSFIKLKFARVGGSSLPFALGPVFPDCLTVFW